MIGLHYHKSETSSSHLGRYSLPESQQRSNSTKLIHQPRTTFRAVIESIPELNGLDDLDAVSCSFPYWQQQLKRVGIHS